MTQPLAEPPEFANERTRASPRERSGERGAPASERVGGFAGAEPPEFPNDVDVAVVTHNGRATLPRVLNCLKASRVPIERIAVYDIGSTDEDNPSGVTVNVLANDKYSNKTVDTAIEFEEYISQYFKEADYNSPFLP